MYDIIRTKARGMDIAIGKLTQPLTTYPPTKKSFFFLKERGARNFESDFLERERERERENLILDNFCRNFLCLLVCISKRMGDDIYRGGGRGKWHSFC